MKNLTGLGDSSDKVRAQIEKEKELLKTLETDPTQKAKAFEELTGEKYTDENFEKFQNGEIALKSEGMLKGYVEGQEMAVDVGADIVSGIAAFGIYTAAVAAAPFTGGVSIAVGVAAAAATGAAVKTGLKAADAASGGRKYETLGRDLATGAFSGALAPLTAGLGGAVGKSTAKAVGAQVLKTGTKEVVELSGKSALKTSLTTPGGFKYAGTLGQKVAAYGAEMATDGAVCGAVDNSFRTAIDGGSLEDIGNAAVEGAKWGAVLSPAIGGGLKLAGKAGAKLGGKAGENASKTPDVTQFDIPKKPLRDLYPKSDIPELTKMKENIKNNAFGTENIKMSGQNYIKFNGTQSGSNPGFWAENMNGDLYYIKTGNSMQNLTEYVASEFYRAAGIDTPEISVVCGLNHTNIKLTGEIKDYWVQSKAVAGLKNIYENPKAAYEGFAVDAWLANWDAVCSGNTLIKDGHAVRLDFGGTFDFRARGARKNFGNEVPELSTLIDPNMNPISANIFKDMTRDDLIESLKRVQSVTKDDIVKTYKNVREIMNPELFATLENRQKYLGFILNEAEKTPMSSSQTIQEYIKTLETSVKQKYKQQIEKMNNCSEQRQRILAECKEQRDAVMTDEELKSLWHYKNSFDSQNARIKEGKTNDPSVIFLQKALNKTEIPENLTLYRGDHFESGLGEINPRYKNDIPEILTVEDMGGMLRVRKSDTPDEFYFLNNIDDYIHRIFKKGKIIKEEQFVSTSLNPIVGRCFGRHNTDILYKYNVPKGIKGTCAENIPKHIVDSYEGISYSYLAGNGNIEASEAEILLNRGFKYKMKNLTFENGHWVIECDILP